MATSDRTARADSSRRARARILVLAMGLSVAALGCSDDDSATPRTTTTTDDDASTASTTSSSSTTSTSETTGTTSSAPPTDQSVEDEITARYLGFWHARLAANSGTPNPDDPALRDFATGEQLETVISETMRRREGGLARSEEHTSDLQSLMRNSYAVCCLK